MGRVHIALVLAFTMGGCWAKSLADIASVPTLPSYLQTCHKRDSSFNECIKKSIISILRSLKDGSTELELQPLDPYNLPLLEVKEGTGEDNVTLWMTFRNTKLLGLSNTDVISVKSSLMDNKLEIVSKTPQLDLTGHFLSDGAVLTFPLSAEGHYSINMSDVTAIWIMYFTRPKVEGRRFLAIDDLDVDVIPASISYQFGELLDGDNTLGEAMNGFINENSHEVFTAMKPKLRTIFKDIIGQVSTTIFSTYPEDILLPP